MGVTRLAELFSHILIAFSILTVAGWRIDWLEREWVAVGMIGAIFPDLNRVEMAISSDSIEALVGLPFGWGGLHTIGGVLVLSAMGALLFPSQREQLRAFGLMVVGGAVHLLTDMVKAWADGDNGMYLYPFSWWRNPTPGWYVSADRWVFVLVASVAIVVVAIDVWRERTSEQTGP